MKTSPFLLFAFGLALFSPPLGAQGIPEIKPEIIHAFAAGVADFQDGAQTDLSGTIYGLSRSGGTLGQGTFFSIDPISPTVTVVASFGPGQELRGTSPTGRLIRGGPSLFYGVTRTGGRFDYGTIFQVSTTGEGETLADLSGTEGAAPGRAPVGLIAGPDNTFYGVTAGSSGFHGPVDYGSVFRFDPASKRFETLIKFTGTTGAAPGMQPDESLFLLETGTLVGTTRFGGKFNRGTIFRLTPAGVFTSYSFTKFGGSLAGSTPSGRMVTDNAQNVYGTAERNAVSATFDGFNGLVWKLPPDGPPAVLMEFGQSPGFAGGVAGGLTSTGLTSAAVILRTGTADGTVKGGVYDITGINTTPVLSQRLAFDGTDGATVDDFITSELFTTTSGRSFFTTTSTLFEVNGSNMLSAYATTTPDNGTGEGSRPVDGVAFDTSNNLFVRTHDGGTNGRGTIFKQPLGGTASVFGSIPGDYFDYGPQPLAIDASGNVLLVDQFGGTNFTGRVLKFDGSSSTVMATFDNTVVGPVYGLTPNAARTVFYGQAMAPQGQGPNLPVVYELNGSTITAHGITGGHEEFASGPLTPFGDGVSFLGVQQSGGPKELGRVFKANVSTNTVSTFTLFGTAASGSKAPVGPAFRETTGSFLVPAYSLKSESVGNAVRLSPTGAPTLLGSATSSEVFDSTIILGPLTEDGLGRVYGLVNRYQGSGSGGVLYRADVAGKLQVIYNFGVDNTFDNPGVEAASGLFLGPDGNIYGINSTGGPLGGGTIFRINTTPQAVATTEAFANVTGTSATLSGSLTNNGYNTEYYFAFSDGNGKGLNLETEHFFTGGFFADGGNVTKTFTLDLTGLKGHTHYEFQFVAKVGFGSDAIQAAGGTLQFDTLNNAPIARDDTILVSSAATSFPCMVLDNDDELDGDTKVVTAVTQGLLGTVTTDGVTVTYTPTAPFTKGQTDSFMYTVADDQTVAGTATATVNVVFVDDTPGEYAGLLFEEEPNAAPIPPDATPVPSPDQIAAGFAQLAVGKTKKFTGRFQIGTRSIAVRGGLFSDRSTRVTGDRGRFTGDLRSTPAGLEARITYNGRTLVLRAGQAFAAVPNAARPASDFTMRFDPTEDADPVSGNGLPPGSGYAVVRQGRNARAVLVGALPDGVAFSARSIVDPDGKFPFRALLSRGKGGTLDGELILDTPHGTVDAAAGTSVRWEKTMQAKAKRFPAGFLTRLTPFGSKYNVPPRNTPPINVAGMPLAATFDRGGLFAPLASKFIFTGAKATPMDGNNAAMATAAFNGRTGIVTGVFRPFGKPVKYRGVVVQRDNHVSGFFLGTADAGTVQMTPDM